MIRVPHKQHGISIAVLGCPVTSISIVALSKKDEERKKKVAKM